MLPSRARVARIRLPVECRQGGLAAGVEGGKCASAISTEYVFYGTIKPESPRCILFSTVHCDGAWVAGGRLLGPGRLRVGVDALAVAAATRAAPSTTSLVLRSADSAVRDSFTGAVRQWRWVVSVGQCGTQVISAGVLTKTLPLLPTFSPHPAARSLH